MSRYGRRSSEACWAVVFSKLNVVVGGVVLVAALVACRSDAVVSALSRSDPSRTTLIQTGRALTHDQLMWHIDSVLPGFAGMFMDSTNGDLVVRLREPHQVAEVKAVLLGVLGSLPGDRAAFKTVAADYSFGELAAWLQIFHMRGKLSRVASTDIHERLNRLVIGVRSANDSAIVRSEAIRAGVPANAILMRVEGERIPAADIRFDVISGRPGGIKILSLQIGAGCTSGYNARISGEWYFLTNAHCTLPRVVGDFPFGGVGTVGGTDFYQPHNLFPNGYVGHEAIDPAWFGSNVNLNCPPSARCRYSDAAAIKYASTAQPAGFQIVRALWPPNPVSGSFTQDPVNPVWTVRAKRPMAVEYETVFKMGASTGFTSSAVIAVCVNDFATASPIPTWFLCQNEAAGSNMLGGDSGGPVFVVGSGWGLPADGASIQGLAHATLGSSWRYSPHGQIEMDFIGHYLWVCNDATIPGAPCP